ncbi:Two-component system WalR/WalK regulatory protein YycH [Paenibacillus sp. CECT 9249]|uniref:YycH family regulatory protein n=1 Tax=Paenibacillus sp. CECT 9249 TaxID=2845385 RepID=UPI001E354568|nr:two-component system activity regulator YycH [Paenibacillus sp. CECT 9249]CAH0121344.1 Two-component system WalR/WalK regulatory protein YycH [Paenibacillus sp. CECT 9249]
MIEKMKSVLLAALVVLSLVQSYFLSYSMPYFEPIQKTESNYVKTEEMGPEEKVENLIFPDQMILHLGEGKHTLFSPDMVFYKEIYKRLQGRKFDGFQRHPYNMMDWNRVRNENQGIELRFSQGVPIALLQRVMQIQADTTFAEEVVDRIWIYTSGDNEDVRSLFFSAKGDIVYEATRADLTVQDVKQHLVFGEGWMPYHSADGKIYLPDEPIEMVQVTLPYQTFTSEQMQRNLFLDPSTTRMIQEKDGSEIFTDGKRSLQVKQDQKWMIFSDPIARADNKNDLSDNVLSAVQFVNQHGGWNGTYRLAIPQHPAEGSEVMFQQYYGAYPIISSDDFRFGHIRLVMQQSVVSGYERSLIHVEDRAESKSIRTLPGGPELEAMIEQYRKNSSYGIEAVFPAYRPVLAEESMSLIPVWAVKLKDGTTDILR